MRGDTDGFRGGIGDDGDLPLYPQPISDGKQQVGIAPDDALYVTQVFGFPPPQLAAGVAVNGLQSLGDTANGLQPFGDIGVNGL